MRSKSDSKRQAILRSAKTVFEETSYERASMDEIAARANSSKATLYNYFDSKEALFFELIHQAAGLHSDPSLPPCTDELPPRVLEVLAVLDPATDIATTLQIFGERVLATFHSPSMLATRRMVIAASNHSDIGKLFFERGPAKAFKIVAAYFAAAMEAGKLRRADPHIAEAQWRGLLNAETLEAGLYNAHPALTDEDIKLICTRAVDAFMRIYAVEKTL